MPLVIIIIILFAQDNIEIDSNSATANEQDKKAQVL